MLSPKMKNSTRKREDLLEHRILHDQHNLGAIPTFRIIVRIL